MKDIGSQVRMRANLISGAGTMLNLSIQRRALQRVSGDRKIVGGMLVAAAAFVLTGCAGSVVHSGFTIYGDSPVARGQMAEKFHRACRKVATPMFSRPSNELVGRCECASTALMNYGEEAQWDELRTVWKRSGTRGEFKNLVAGMSLELYESHCRGADDDSKLEVVTLRGLETADKHEDEKAIPESEVMQESQPEMPTGTFSATTEVVNSSLQLDPLALKDPDLIKFIQRKLESLGHFPGPIDGVIGKQTKSALQEYRQAQEISDTVSDEEVMSTLIY